MRIWLAAGFCAIWTEKIADGGEYGTPGAFVPAFETAVENSQPGCSSLCVSDPRIRHDLTLCCSIRAEFVGYYPLGRKALSHQEPGQQRSGSLGVAAVLHDLAKKQPSWSTARHNQHRLPLMRTATSSRARHHCRKVVSANAAGISWPCSRARDGGVTPQGAGEAEFRPRSACPHQGPVGGLSSRWSKSPRRF